LSPGWNSQCWPFIFKIEKYPITEIKAGEVGLLTAADGLPLPGDATYAPEWPEGEDTRMTVAEHFLGDGKGYRGPQTSVLDPGKYRINPKLFTLKRVPATTVQKAQVAVVKSNVGERVTGEGGRTLVNRGQRGIWREPLLEGQYYLNTDAHEVTPVSTKMRIVHFTTSTAARGGGTGDERQIIVRTSDGFTFPVDVRVEYEIKPQDAPLLVATVGDDEEGLRQVMDSRVRAIFRNNAENVKALDYVKQRSNQESQSLKMLQAEMGKIGVTITGVRIGDVGDEKSLGTLLKTQTDREIALQEQLTFQEQQRAAEQKKQLSRTEQESEEEKRLATASYQVQIAEQEQKKRVITAEAEAQATLINAKAQSDAYELIAGQIGPANAALIEVLKIVGERGIQITPRVMVSEGGTGGANGNGQATALIGTMLDTMVDRAPPQSAAPTQSASPASTARPTR
jgi:regulator of protease activity HflC (stomatin/prohibitin superfamily)